MVCEIDLGYVLSLWYVVFGHDFALVRVQVVVHLASAVSGEIPPGLMGGLWLNVDRSFPCLYTVIQDNAY